MIKTIKTRLILTVSFIVFLSILCVSAIVYQQNMKKIQILLGQKVESIAKTSATLINGDKHQKVVENLQGANDMPEFKEIQQALARVKKENGLQEDVYTMMDVYWVPADKENPHGQVMFTAMATSETFQPKGQKKEKYVHESMTKKKAGYTDIFETINGLFITGYAPIITSKGAVTAVVEVALEVGKEIHQAKMNLIKGIIIAALIALFIAIILTVFSAQKISSPIKKLTGVVQKMSGGDLEARVEGIKTNDEIEILGDGFNEMAINLERSYKELENYSKNLEKMVAERTAELAAANRKITAILNNMKLGVFVVDENLKIQPPASAYCNTIFNQDVVETDVMETLFGDLSHDDPVRSCVESANIAIYGEDDFQWGLMEGEYPTELTAKNKETGEDQYLEIKYSPLWDEDGNLSELLYVVDDVTELKKLQKEAEKARQESEITNRILTQLASIDTASLEGHFNTFRKLFDSIISNIEQWENVKNIYMDLHTAKGNSKVLGFSIIAATVHQIESNFGKYKTEENLGEEERKEFLEAIDEVLLTIGRYNGLATKVFKIKNFFRFPDTNLYFKFFVDYLSGGNTQESLVKELHNTIDDSIPETCISIVDDAKVVNWQDVLNTHLKNMCAFNGLTKIPMTRKTIVNIAKASMDITNKSFSLVEIEGASYFTSLLGRLNKWTPENQERVKKDLNLLMTYLISIDFLNRSTRKDQDGVRKLVSNKSSTKDIVDYLSSTPLTLMYNLKTQEDNEALEYIIADGLQINLLSELFNTSKDSLTRAVELLDLAWREEDKKVSFQDNPAFKTLGLHLFSFGHDFKDEPLYTSMGSILMRALTFQFNNPLCFYTPDESISVNVSNYMELEKWFNSNAKQGRDESVLNNIKRYPLCGFVATYAPFIEKKALELGKFVRVIADDDSVLISKEEFSVVEDCLVHLLTNSLVHGIELEDQRIINDKNKFGKIVVGTTRDDAGNLSFFVQDDGAGLNFDEMKLAIKNSETVSSVYKDDLKEKEIFEIFLTHSVSTMKESDMLAGRGEGLSTLGRLRDLKAADVNYESKSGEGTKFMIKLL